MSEQQAPPEDTPDVVDTPEQGTDTQDQPNWEERYKEAQAWGTQNAQRAAELERYEQAIEGLHSDDPDTRQWAAQALGIELAEEETDDTFVDPTEQLAKEIEQIKSAMQQQAQLEQQQAAEARDLEVIGTGLKQIQTKIGRDLTQHEIGLLGDAAWSNRDEQGLPNIAAVAAAYEEVLALNAPKKPRPRAPHFSSVGQEGTQAAGPLTHQERVARAMEKLQTSEQ